MERREGSAVRRSLIRFIPIVLIEAFLLLQSIGDQTHVAITFALVLSPLAMLFLLDLVGSLARARGTRDLLVQVLDLPIRIFGAAVLLMGIILGVWIPVSVVLMIVEPKWRDSHVGGSIGAGAVAVGFIVFGWKCLRSTPGAPDPSERGSGDMIRGIGEGTYRLGHAPGLSSPGPRAGAVAAQEASHTQTAPDPSKVKAALQLGDFYRAQGKYDEAIEAYQDGLTADPSNTDLRALIDQMKKARPTG